MEGITKTIEFAGTKGMSARVTVKETYDIAANTSVLTVGVALSCANYYGHIYYLTGSVSAGGDDLQTMSSSDGTHSVYIQSRNTYYAVKANADGHTGSPWVSSAISHKSDGTKSVTISVEIAGYEPSGKGANGFTISGSQSVTLTSIPRESTIGATDANIGATSAIAISRQSSSFKHTIAYKFGELSGYVTESGGTSTTAVKLSATSVPFKVPTGFYQQIPNEKTGVCTLTCRTYSGSTQIGEAKKCTFTATAGKDACRPSVKGVVEDTNETTVVLTGDKNKFVRYASDALCTITATAKNAAAISKKTIGGKTVSGSTRTISGIDGTSVKFSATDSRGYTTSTTVNVDLVEYIPLTCVVTGKRTDATSGDAKLTIKGDYFGGSFGAKDNTLTLRYKKDSGSWVSVSPTIKSGTYSASVSLSGLDYTQSYTFTVEAKDKLVTITKTVKIDKGIPVFDWGESDFAFHVPVKHDGGFAPVDLAGSSLIESEQDFLTALEEVYAPMGNKRSLWIRFRGFPASGDFSFYGMLTKTNENSGCLFVQSAYADGVILTLVKRSGAWKVFEREPLKSYPVGSIYMSVSSTSPASLFGGTWERMKDYVLVGASDNFSAGAAAGVISFASGGGSSGQQAICLAVYMWKRTE